MTIHNIFISEETHEELKESVKTVLETIPSAVIQTQRYDPSTGLWIAKGFYYDTTGD